MNYVKQTHVCMENPKETIKASMDWRPIKLGAEEG